MMERSIRNLNRTSAWSVHVDRRGEREIDEELAKYRTKRAAGPEALKIVQRYRGWISDESLRDVARYLELSR